MSLSPRHQKFVSEYLVDFNGKQAAIRAGYSARTAASQASRLLTNVNIAAAIAESVAGQRAQAEAKAKGRQVTIEDVRAELARIGFADIRQIVKWRSNVTGMVEDPDTGEMDVVHVNDVALVNSEDLPDEAAAAIAEVSKSSTGALKVKLHSRLGALVALERSLSQAARPPAGKSKGEAPKEATPASPASSGWEELLDNKRPN